MRLRMGWHFKRAAAQLHGVFLQEKQPPAFADRSKYMSTFGIKVFADEREAEVRYN